METQLRIRAIPDPVGSLIAELNQFAEAEVSPADEQGIYDVRVNAPPDSMDDVETTIARWNLEHPDQVLPPG